MVLEATAVSAPGKVLLAGGYLVLDREYSGLVFALNARIHVHIQQELGASSEIVVRSPQFLAAEWKYKYENIDTGSGLLLSQTSSSADVLPSENPFVETALSYALNYIASAGGVVKPSLISILADDDYYSQASPSQSQERRKENVPRQFTNFNVPLLEAHKTGLGSSAALVTALTGVLLSFYLSSDVFNLADDSSRTKLHNLAQAAHCAAQGKIGSGFDVAAAVYGSCLYRRFSPSVLLDVGAPGEPGFTEGLKRVVNDSEVPKIWDTEVLKTGAKLPSGLRLVMCDVDCGSQTVGMVKKLLAWRKDQPAKATQVWNELQRQNTRLCQLMSSIDKQQQQNPEAFIRSLGIIREGGTQAQTDEVWAGDYLALKHTVSSIRSLIREMSVDSGVPIEPRSQTALLDECSSITGVLGGVVPGAGGYDAIALITVDQEDVLSALKRLLDGWSDRKEKDADDQTGKIRVLRVREELEGARKEQITAYTEWINNLPQGDSAEMT